MFTFEQVLNGLSLVMLSHPCISEKLEIDRKERHFRADGHRAILEVNLLASLPAAGRLVPRHGASASDEDESRVGNQSIIESKSNISSHFSVYPNPSNNIVYFKLNADQNEIYSVKIYDIQAKTVFQQVFNESIFEIVVSHMKPGIYRYIIFNSKNQLFQGNLVIIHH